MSVSGGTRAEKTESELETFLIGDVENCLPEALDSGLTFSLYGSPWDTLLVYLRNRGTQLRAALRNTTRAIARPRQKTHRAAQGSQRVDTHSKRPKLFCDAMAS